MLFEGAWTHLSCGTMFCFICDRWWIQTLHILQINVLFSRACEPFLDGNVGSLNHGRVALKTVKMGLDGTLCLALGIKEIDRECNCTSSCFMLQKCLWAFWLVQGHLLNLIIIITLLQRKEFAMTSQQSKYAWVVSHCETKIGDA